MMTEEALSVVEPVITTRIKRTKKPKMDLAPPDAVGYGPGEMPAPAKPEKQAKVTKYPVGTKTVTEKVAPKKKATTVRKPKAVIEPAKPAKKAQEGSRRRVGLASRREKAAKGDLTMGSSRQRRDGVATGTAIAGGARQTVATFPQKQFDQIAKLAAKDGVSFAEQVRRLCAKGIKA